MKLKHYLYCFFSLISFFIRGQDAHWSQYQATPLNINPSYTGLFDPEHLRKTVRACINYRQQWRTIRSEYSVGATPFSTYSFALDGNISNLPFMGQDIIGLGISTFKDEAGDLNLSTLQTNLYFSYHKSINQNSDQFISLGMNWGKATKYIDFSKASYDSQWDGKAYNSNSSTGENSDNLSKSYKDFSIGLSHYFSPHYGIKMRTGVSGLHLNRPSQSLYNQSAPMYINWILNHDMIIPAWKKWDYLPSVLLMKQGPASEFVIFNAFRLGFNNNEYHQLGIGYRIVGNYKTPISHDAPYFAYKFGYYKWSIGFSYDMNISSLNYATSTLGAFEISLIYHEHPFKKPRAKHRRSKNKCPDVHPSGKKKILY